jgi:hypothetical protein
VPQLMICVMSPEDVDQWVGTGIRPRCETHKHVPFAVAMRWHDHPRWNCLERAEWCGKTALMVVREEVPVVWRTVLSGGVPVKQLVPGPTPHVTGVRCWCGETHARQDGIPSAGAHSRRQDVRVINRGASR